MVRGFDNERLLRSGLASRGERCFVQRWLELLHPRTIDSYAAKVMNAHGALQELREVLHAVLATQIDPGHLRSVWAETRAKVKDDPALKTQAAFLREAFLRLLTSEPPIHEPQRLRQVLTELSALNEILEDRYAEWNFSTLEAAFRDGDGSTAAAVAEALASEFLRSHDAHSLYDLGQLLCSANFDEQWRKFKSVLRRDPELFLVFVPVHVSNPEAIRRVQQNLGFSVVDREELEGRLTSHVHDLRKHYAVRQVEAHDYRVAVKRAMADVDQRLGLVSFFLASSGRVPDGTAFVQYGDPPRIRPIPFEVEQHAEEKFDKLAWAAEVLASTRVDAVSRGRIMDAIQYASYARRAHSPTSRFLGNWVALETLVRQAGSAIEAMSRYVVPILCNDYIYRLVRNFLDDCVRCAVDLAGVLGCPVADYPTATHVFVEVVQDDRKRAELVQRCSHHDCLALRAQQLSDQLLNGKSTRSLLQGHRQRLEWHLYRLYRIRNEIVHAGKATELVEPCLLHLEDYVYRVTTTVLYLMRRHRLTSVSSALSLAQHDLAATLEYLDSTDSYDPRVALRGALLRD